MKIRTLFRTTVIICLSFLFLAKSVLPPGNEIEQFRAFTREIEFDYIHWSLNSIYVKAAQAALNPTHYMEEDQQKSVVNSYLQLTEQINQTQSEIESIYADPEISDPETAASTLLKKQEVQFSTREKLGPLAESIIQEQVSSTLAEMDLSLGGQPIPPLLYRVTPLPLALIVSSRDEIQQIADISLLPDLTLDQIAALENAIEDKMDVSALIVNVGGIGMYPTMVMNTTNFTFLVEVVSHEWTHNFLTLRPLGLNYNTSPELRTINETTANLSGKEIQYRVFERFYPERLPSPPPAQEEPEEQEQDNPEEKQEIEQDPEVFDFRAEMRETRVNADKLLEEGKIEDAESYMEERRQLFVANGYRLRKLNQAYFAFHGAYADQPGGAAGEDPIGPKVVELREESENLSEFLHRIAWITSFEELEKVVEKQTSIKASEAQTP